MIPTNKSFFTLLFISTISTCALYSQKDELQPEPPVKQNSLTGRFKKNPLQRSKSSRHVPTAIIEQLTDKEPVLLVRSRSFTNKLTRSRSLKNHQQPTIEPNPVLRFAVLRKKIKNEEILQELQQYPDALHVQDENGTNLLHLAARYNKIIIAYHLVKKGIDINASTITGQTALDIAAERHHDEFVEFIKLNNIPLTYK